LTKTFAKELGARKIRVNAVNPGPIETDGVRARGAVEQFRLLGKQRSLQRVGSTDDVTPLVAFLASDDAAWITGESYYVTGGIS
jgi:3-oxoacyl-[acyl-carrier protein] reductase